MQHALPRFILAGLSGGTGKTIVTLALARALERRGVSVAPFKKGPDYIDAKWLGLAAGRSCSNLDPHFHTAKTIQSLFFHKSSGMDISLVEGNRGLFDGKDEHGSCSTAELARQLDAPVILTIDCTKMTRTVAAIVQGCANMEPGLNLAGVILNRTAGERHRSVLKKSIETHTNIPVLGMLPKIRKNPIPERHMGLLSDQEYAGQSSLDELADIAEKWLDIEAIQAIAEKAPPMETLPPVFEEAPSEKRARIGYIHDASLWFYYQENFEALEHAGAELVRLSILSDEPWPEIDGLYIGGGFPEVFAERIASNSDVLEHIRELSHSGMPIYAECGGFMLLCDFLEIDGARHAMSGVFPVGTTFCQRPQGLGYTVASVVSDNLFYMKGEQVLGHEFHYSVCVNEANVDLPFTLQMVRGKGIGGDRDGLLYENTFAGYNHIHALAVPEWAPRFVAAAADFSKKRNDSSVGI